MIQKDHHRHAAPGSPRARRPAVGTMPATAAEPLPPPRPPPAPSRSTWGHVFAGTRLSPSRRARRTTAGLTVTGTSTAKNADVQIAAGAGYVGAVGPTARRSLHRDHPVVHTDYSIRFGKRVNASLFVTQQRRPGERSRSDRPSARDGWSVSHRPSAPRTVGNAAPCATLYAQVDANASSGRWWTNRRERASQEACTMQFGIFTVSDVTTDPTTGRTPDDTQRVKDILTIAEHADQAGLDVFATGEHHNPPFVASSPTTMLGYLAGRTKHITLSTSTTLITTNDPVRIAEEYAMLQVISDGRNGPHDGPRQHRPCTPGSARTIRQGVNLAIEHYALSRPARENDVVDWQGKFRTPLQGFTSTPASARRCPAVRLARLDPHARDRRAGCLLRRRLPAQQHLLADPAHRADGRSLPPALRALRARQTADQAIVGLGGQFFARKNSQDAWNEFRPYFDNAPVYGHAPRWRTSPQTPLTRLPRSRSSTGTRR